MNLGSTFARSSSYFLLYAGPFDGCAWQAMLRNERTLRINPLEMLAKAYSLRARLSLHTRAVMPTKPNPSNARLEGSGTATRKPRISPPVLNVE